jgi:hypothetical protein
MQAGIADVAAAVRDSSDDTQSRLLETQMSFLSNQRLVKETLHAQRIGIDGKPDIVIPEMQRVFPDQIQVACVEHFIVCNKAIFVQAFNFDPDSEEYGGNMFVFKMSTDGC